MAKWRSGWTSCSKTKVQASTASVGLSLRFVALHRCTELALLSNKPSNSRSRRLHVLSARRSSRLGDGSFLLLPQSPLQPLPHLHPGSISRIHHRHLHQDLSSSPNPSLPSHRRDYKLLSPHTHTHTFFFFLSTNIIFLLSWNNTQTTHAEHNHLLRRRQRQNKPKQPPFV